MTEREQVAIAMDNLAWRLVAMAAKEGEDAEYARRLGSPRMAVGREGRASGLLLAAKEAVGEEALAAMIELADKEAKMPETLEKLGTPWAECYGGSGRLTGRLAESPAYCSNGDVAPGWVYHGEKTEEEFYALFEEAQHDQCHTPGRADWGCPHCQAAGWATE